MKCHYDTCILIIDAYCDTIGSFSSEVKKLFTFLLSTTKREVQMTEELLKLQGALELIFASASLSSTQAIESNHDPGMKTSL